MKLQLSMDVWELSGNEWYFSFSMWKNKNNNSFETQKTTEGMIYGLGDNNLKSLPSHSLNRRIQWIKILKKKTMK
jgi:hypothetical protein